MNFYTQFKKVKPRVKAILRDDPRARDDDLYLLSKVWSDEIEKTLASPSDILFMMENRNLTTPESVRRARQQLQEKYLDFRGKTYGKRHGLANHVREDINKEDE